MLAVIVASGCDTSFSTSDLRMLSRFRSSSASLLLDAAVVAVVAVAVVAVVVGGGGVDMVVGAVANALALGLAGVTRGETCSSWLDELRLLFDCKSSVGNRPNAARGSFAEYKSAQKAATERARAHAHTWTHQTRRDAPNDFSCLQRAVPRGDCSLPSASLACALASATGSTSSTTSDAVVHSLLSSRNGCDRDKQRDKEQHASASHEMQRAHRPSDRANNTIGDQARAFFCARQFALARAAPLTLSGDMRLAALQATSDATTLAPSESPAVDMSSSTSSKLD